jgi:hypothetical protein
MWNEGYLRMSRKDRREEEKREPHVEISSLELEYTSTAP